VNNIRERLKRLEKKNKLDLQSPFKTIEKDFPSREAESSGTLERTITLLGHYHINTTLMHNVLSCMS